MTVGEDWVTHTIASPSSQQQPNIDIIKWIPREEEVYIKIKSSDLVAHNTHYYSTIVLDGNML